MNLLAFLPAVLLAAKAKHNIYFIDGFNCMGHSRVPNKKHVVIEKLKEINQDNTDVVLVWDGRTDDGGYTRKEQDDDLTIITTRDGLTADDYILGEIQSIHESGAKQLRVAVVTGDRKLRKQAHKLSRVCNKIVNPSVFWSRYRPRLAGLKHKDPSEYKIPPGTQAMP
uniref:NYN domain-containing protein n=1 Tax=Grammatophora oceanica TaxID=210454 RepID=A0A7S1Y451_9STRA|mmetsp:Transcript_17862/g.26459  ORF Transcript_17862/g.26459 Transcript_17862/m.26459 type:complete len:168 (+) Transcript_17862:57-560(+)